MVKRRRSEQLKIVPRDSGVVDFPVITDYESHIIVCVVHVEDSKKYLKIVGQLIDKSNREEKKTVEIILRDFWRDSKFLLGTKLRLISPLVISDTVSFIKIFACVVCYGVLDLRKYTFKQAKRIFNIKCSFYMK